MKSQTLMQLNQVPDFRRADVARDAIKCKVCNSIALKFDVVDFNKICSPVEYYPYGFSGIIVNYYKCGNCGLLFTDFCDDWTREDFARFIYNADYPLVDEEYASVRPERIAAEMAGFLQDHRSARIVDYGSGTGVFAERLRSVGFAEVCNYDLFSSPSRPGGRFDIITCFETIEHSPFPGETIADLVSFMKPDGCIIVITAIQPPNIAELRANWWYIAPRNGHVSIYTLAALEVLGASVGLELYSGNGKLAFAGRSPSPQLMPLLRAIGPALRSVRLTAPFDQPSPAQPMPAATSADVDWHAVEQSGATRFRWTRTSRIEWRLQDQPGTYPCRLTITIPLVHEISAGFAERCTLEIGSHSYPVQRAAGAITAVAELDQPLRQPIALITPEPLRPSDLLGTSDRRALGLAIALAADPG